jgi:hypothetical protein
LRIGRQLEEVPCACVFRAIFRACYERFLMCSVKEKYMSQINLEMCSRGKESHTYYGRKVEEYIADFCLVSRRALDNIEYDIFRFHYLLGADSKACCRRLKVDRGTFYHAAYRIEEKLGRVFRELEPYSLYPLDEYFGGTIRKARPGGRRPPAVIAMPAMRSVFNSPQIRRAA